MEIKLNLNQHVKIKLTDFGKHMLKAEHECLWVLCPPIDRPKFLLPEEDAEGWSEWQLHDVFEKLGIYVGMRKGQVPFEPDIILCYPKSINNVSG